MALVTELHRFETNLAARIRTGLENARRVIVRRRAYSTTFKELSRLADHELADLGIGRSEIRNIAQQAANQI